MSVVQPAFDYALPCNSLCLCQSVMGLIAMSTIVPTFFLKEGPRTESI